MNIRKFSSDDRKALREIYFAPRSRAFYWMDSAVFTLADFDRDTKGELIWVASKNDFPVGFISIWEPVNFIHNLFVHPEVVGQGIGSKLLDVILGEIGRPVTLKCSEQNTKAKKFYLAKGWRVVATGKGQNGKYDLMRFEDES